MSSGELHSFGFTSYWYPLPRSLAALTALGALNSNTPQPSETVSDSGPLLSSQSLFPVLWNQLTPEVSRRSCGAYLVDALVYNSAESDSTEVT